MASNLPDYVAAARPIPQGDRAPWYANTAPTYAGIMLWFVFWHEVPLGSVLQAGKPYSQFAGGTLAQGLGVAFLGLVVAALICYFLFYLVPGMLGQKTGLPLYIVGTSTYGVQGGFLMPGFLMGVLQYGWLAVNSYFAAILLCAPFGHVPGTLVFNVVVVVWAVAAAFLGLKGIQYVAKVATFLPLIPLVILLILFFKTASGIGSFDPKALIDAGASVQIKGEGAVEMAVMVAKAPLSTWGIIALLSTYIVGFFATAGAAGTDFGMNNRNENDVRMGGLIGIAGATIFAGGLALLIVAGAHGSGIASDGAALQATALMTDIVGEKQGAILWYLLAIAAFPPACFSSFIAANSFKTTLPKVNPYISCGIGTLVAILLAVTGYAGNAVGVFKIIGASFGPICGAMAADYLLSGKQWAGPRAGFNMAGWISWLIGFAVGAADFIPPIAGKVPCPPVAAFIVGFALYMVLAKAGLESKKLEMPGAEAGA
jgi:purine-cytosine permease-like protein